jgi:hypothetical protein
MAHAKTRRGQWAGSRSGRVRVGCGLARWSTARGGTAKRAGGRIGSRKDAKTQRGKGRRPDAIAFLSWRLCVLSEAGVRNSSERGVAVRCVKKRGICRPSGAGCSWEDGTQRSRAGLQSGGPSGLGPGFGKTRSCRGVSGSNPVLPGEFSIPMPIPIPIPTRVARGCRATLSSDGGVSSREFADGHGIRGDGTGLTREVPFFAASREISFHSRDGSREDAKTRRGQWAGSRSGRFRVGGGLARWSAARGGTAKRAGGRIGSRKDAKTQRGGGTKTGCHCLPVLAFLRLERSGREESVRAGSCCPVCEEAGNLSPLRGWFSWGGRNPALTRWAIV